jgi:Secretion system C-terminal sorting domain
MQKLFTAFLFLISFIAKSQSGYLSVFNAQQINDSVLLSLTVNAGNLCNGLDIQRSTDTAGYISIGDIQGICGSPSDDVSYTFIDRNPVFNKTIYYRVNTPGYGYSQVASILLRIFSSADYFLYPNPASGYFNLEFENNDRSSCEIAVYNISGNLVYETTTNEKIIRVDTKKFLAGVYLFSILKSNQKQITGKFIVLSD